MAFDEDYRELIDNAQDAVRALLAGSSEDSWLELRAGLREIRQALLDYETRDRLEEELRIAREQREEFKARREALKQGETDHAHERQERCERKREWRHMPMPCKESLIIEALGDDQLRPDDLVSRINELVGWTANPCVPHSSVETLLRRLLASGQLDRVQVPIGRREIWHYFRNRNLSGPIVALERAYHDEAEAA